ncbi:hypothetical protein [Gluconobacter cerinus]|uniref:hypothetical protein n=1 Tax=Gluconobacter cerinus TaxID=38307 RepID=UPI001B8D836C|nr:hypothetical protein [Gluconobacter cerinus]MBS1038075.1 hypothetical protein [Gluconobacter cerinus]
MFTTKLVSVARNADSAGLTGRDKFQYLLKNLPNTYQQDDELMAYIFFQILAVLFEEFDEIDAPTNVWMDIDFTRSGESWHLDDATAGMTWTDDEHPLIQNIWNMDETGIEAIGIEIAFNIFRNTHYVLPGYSEADFGDVKIAVASRVARNKHLEKMRFVPVVIDNPNYSGDKIFHQEMMDAGFSEKDYQELDKTFSDISFFEEPVEPQNDILEQRLISLILDAHEIAKTKSSVNCSDFEELDGTLSFQE